LIFLALEGMNFYFKLEFAPLKLIDGLWRGFSRDANTVERGSIQRSVTAAP